MINFLKKLMKSKPKIIFYNVCEECKNYCSVKISVGEKEVYDPFWGSTSSKCEFESSSCCDASFETRKSLPLTPRAKSKLLKIFSTNQDIVNHINNVLPYIGDVYE